jgi:hypothetical protein
MREDLLGYLLGALEPDEARRMEELLKTDPSLREELAAVEAMLRPLEDASNVVDDLPSGLVERTLAKLPTVGNHTDLINTPDSNDSRSTLVSLPTLGMSNERALRPTRRWADWAAGSFAAAVLLGLLLPSLAEGRFAARRNACQDQLRRFGTAITQFVMMNQQQKLPSVAESGPEAFAGMYAIRLFEAGLLDDPNMRLCPSSAVGRNPDAEQAFTELNEFVATKQLHSASTDQLVRWQQRAGGDYAYSLGVIDGNHYSTPRYEARSSFAVMSDSPVGSLVNHEIRANQIGHSGRGMNVLYEDGRVQFISVDSLQSIPDHPLFNDRGTVEAGVDLDDAVLAPSWRPPFIGTPQR